jgi:hypothetical protein
MKQRGLGRMALEHIEPHRQRRSDEHHRHHGPAAPRG